MENSQLITKITDEMLAARPLSYSRLKDFRVSPKHFMYYLNNPKQEKDAWTLGKATECLVFEPTKFAEKFEVYDKPAQRTDAAKEAHKLVVEGAQRRKVTLISPEDYEKAKNCRTSVMDTEEARRFVESKGKLQVKVQWTDRETRLPIIGYIDKETYVWDTDFIVDFKTTANADPEAFHRDIFKLDYILQDGVYREGYKRVKFRFPTMLFLAVETKEPYGVSLNYCDNKFNKRAEEEFLGTLKAFRYCMDRNLWHQGYEFRLSEGMGYFPVNVPFYYKNKFTSYNFDDDGED